MNVGSSANECRELKKKTVAAQRLFYTDNLLIIIDNIFIIYLTIRACARINNAKISNLAR